MPGALVRVDPPDVTLLINFATLKNGDGSFVLLGTTLCQVTRGGGWGGVGTRGGRVGGTYIRGSTYL